MCLTVCCHVEKARRLTGERGRRRHPKSFTDERFHSLLASSRQSTPAPPLPPPPIGRQWTCLIKKRSDIRTCNFCERLGGRRRDGGGGGGTEEVRNSPRSFFFFLKNVVSPICPSAPPRARSMEWKGKGRGGSALPFSSPSTLAALRRALPRPLPSALRRRAGA